MNYGVKKAIAGTRRGFRKAGQAIQGFDDDAYRCENQRYGLRYELAPAPVQAFWQVKVS